MSQPRSTNRYLEDNPHLLDHDLRSYDFIREVMRYTRHLLRFHDFRIDGFDRVPDGPCLVVANHSAAAIQETLMVMHSWHERFGDRPARGLAHRAVFAFPFRHIPLVPKLGGIFAHPAVAKRYLAEGCAVLVFPGGEMEVARPFRDRHLVTLGSRSGFVRIAREANVPIVPLVLCGSHASYVVVPGAARFARWLRMHRLLGVKAVPMTVGGLALAVALANPLLWPVWPLAALQAVLPYPSQVKAEVLDPVYVGDGESDEEVADRVRQRMQETMNRLAGERSPNLLERISERLRGRRREA